MLSRAEYAHAFEVEAAHTYPVIDALEVRLGYALSPLRYLYAAERLACPIKRDKHGQLRQVALWQHGRVLYSVARERFSHLLTAALGRAVVEPIVTLDIGTAKGYSALCVQWAIDDAGLEGTIHTVDVLDPLARVERHSAAEVEGYLTLAEYLAPWPEAARIQAHQSTGIAWLEAYDGRLPFVYVDGKHTGPTPRKEAQLIRDRQERGDVAVFDDVQIREVADTVGSLAGYDVEYVRPLPTRAYAIARRR